MQFLCSQLEVNYLNKTRIEKNSFVACSQDENQLFLGDG